MVLMTKKGNTLKSLAIICDGNRRSSPDNPLKGHTKGAKNLKKICEFCQKKGIKVLTIYALSIDNLNRTKKELRHHFSLHKKFIKQEILNSDRFVKEGIRFTVFGKKELLPNDEQELIKKAEEKTKNNNPKMFFNVCLAYDFREEVVNAVKKIIRDKIKPGHIDEKVFQWYLWSGKLENIDLVIRTGMGNKKYPEQRLSGFLGWFSVYSQIHFTPTLFPNFSVQQLGKIIKNFEKVEIRRGK